MRSARVAMCTALLQVAWMTTAMPLARADGLNEPEAKPPAIAAQGRRAGDLHEQCCPYRLPRARRSPNGPGSVREGRPP